MLETFCCDLFHIVLVSDSFYTDIPTY